MVRGLETLGEHVHRVSINALKNLATTLSNLNRFLP